MPDTLLSSLSSALTLSTREEIARSLGESEQGRAQNRRISMLVTQK
jgi:flagellar motor protein MotB